VELRAGGVLAAFLTLYLASGWRTGGRSRAMFLAVSLCALWGMLALAFALTGGRFFSPAACWPMRCASAAGISFSSS
jgi:hypothetical protein